MSDAKADAKDIFLGALDCASPEELASYLDKACAGDTALRTRVEELLSARREAGSFLGGAWSSPTEDLSPSESLGTLIGPYKLLEQIGEGGMGVVYMADQQAPVRRRVALKVIKTGMDTRQVIARFEAERQALALMDHANIARVLDAGATDTGRPYFVMELVRGIPITEYCDQNNLPVHERLELFIQVCQAVQHAHQKGIIHRDLKPSNVLVTLNDGRAVPKVIDFGVAKATGQQLTEKTLFTAFAQMVGTPLYMSPEQAEMTSLDIDTRSDIYSLGVLLYELLTGTTPFDQERMRSAAFDEIRRIIREEEPPKPSTRLSTLGDARTATAAHRQVDSRRLSQLVEGDLDWIVMKALEKDRARRYDTATGLAEDIQRYLSDQPVDACSPTRIYRLKKFIRRNRVGVLAGSAITAALIIGLAASTWMFLRERQARARAVAAEQVEIRLRQQAEADKKTAKAEANKSQQVAQFLNELLEGVFETQVKGRDTSILREIVDKSAERVANELKDQPEVEAKLLETIGGVYCEIGPLEKAETMQREALKIRREVFGEEHLEVASSLFALGYVHWRQVDLADAERLTREALQMQRKLGGPDYPDTGITQVHLGGILWSERKLVESEAVLKEAVQLMKRLHGEGSWQCGWALMYLGKTLEREDKLDDAENTLRDAVAISRNQSHPDIRTLANTLRTLGDLLQRTDKHAEAETVLREAVTMQRMRSDQQRDPYLAWALDSLATVLESQGRLGEAEELRRETLDIKNKVFGDRHLETTETLTSLICVLKKEGKTAEAEKLQREASESAGVAHPERSPVSAPQQ